MQARAADVDVIVHTGYYERTSANISGGRDPSDANQVLAQLNGRIPLVLDGGPTHPRGVIVGVTMQEVQRAIFRLAFGLCLHLRTLW